MKYPVKASNFQVNQVQSTLCKTDTIGTKISVCLIESLSNSDFKNSDLSKRIYVGSFTVWVYSSVRNTRRYLQEYVFISSSTVFIFCSYPFHTVVV